MNIFGNLHCDIHIFLEGINFAFFIDSNKTNSLKTLFWVRDVLFMLSWNVRKQCECCCYFGLPLYENWHVWHLVCLVYSIRALSNNAIKCTRVTCARFSKSSSLTGMDRVLYIHAIHACSSGMIFTGSKVFWPPLACCRRNAGERSGLDHRAYLWPKKKTIHTGGGF